VQVAGRRCAKCDAVITFEVDARLCAQCGQVYHREHVPDRCVTCDAELKSS
jgi:primosomal protein N'